MNSTQEEHLKIIEYTIQKKIVDLNKINNIK